MGGIDAVPVDFVIALEGRGQSLPTVVIGSFCECAGLVYEDERYFECIFGVDFLNRAMLTFLASSCPTIMDSLSASTLVISAIGTSVSSYSSMFV